MKLKRFLPLIIIALFLFAGYVLAQSSPDTRTSQQVQDLFAHYNYDVAQEDITYWTRVDKYNDFGDLVDNLDRRFNKDKGIEIEEGFLGGGGGTPVTDYQTTLVVPMTSATTSLQVASTLTSDNHQLVTADITPAAYLMIDAGGTNQEIIKCADVTTTLWKECTRGLAFFGRSETTVTANQKPHSSGVTVTLSNVHFYYISLNEENTWTSIQTYDVYPEINSSIGDATTTSQFITLGQLNNVTNAGAATSTPTNAGISELSTQIENASSTPFGILDPHVIQSQHASSSPFAQTNFITQNQGNATSTASSSDFFAQTFLTNTDTVQISEVSLSLKRVGSLNATFDVGIFSIDSNKKPTSTALVTFSLQTNTIATSTEWATTTVIFSTPLNVTSSTTFALVLSDNSVTADNHLQWEYQNSDVYLPNGGTKATSTDSGVIWNLETDQDFQFEVKQLNGLNVGSVSGLTVIVSENDGKIDIDWFDLTKLFSFSNFTSASTTNTGNIFNIGNATSTGSSIFSGLLNVTGDTLFTNASTTETLNIATTTGQLCFGGTSKTIDCKSKWGIDFRKTAYWEFSLGVYDDFTEANMSVESGRVFMRALSTGTNASVSAGLPGTGADRDLQGDDTLTVEMSSRVWVDDTSNEHCIGMSSNAAAFHNPDYIASSQSAVVFCYDGTVFLARTMTNNNSESTDISGVTLTDWNLLTIEWDGNNDTVNFYVNGDLKVTHNTSTPDQAVTMSFGAGSDATTDEIDFSDVFFRYKF